MGFGIYLSPWDRNSPLYGTDAYNDYFVNQLTELLTQYGRIDEVWFDGANGEGPNGRKQVYDFDRWYQLIRKLQPSAAIAIMGPDVRWVGTESGYGRPAEWSVVPVDQLAPGLTVGGSQTDIAFTPSGDITGDDLGSREKISHAKGLVWYPAETDVSIRPGWFYHEEENGKIKTPEKLLDIYFHSVGRNSVLLLNLPPDKEGLIDESDVRVLKEWKKLRDQIFNKNLIKKARITCANGIRSGAILDGQYDTYWTTGGNDTTSVIELSLQKPGTFNVLLLQENIAVGQRIEKFELDYWNGHAWEKAAEGTTVGYKRLLQFNSVTTDKVRLQILSSRLNPTIAELGLYYNPVPQKNN
jgi:alpha-L-fucosidase